MVRTSTARVRVRVVRAQHDPGNLSLNLSYRKKTQAPSDVSLAENSP